MRASKTIFFESAFLVLEMNFVSRMLAYTQAYQLKPQNALFNSEFLVLDLNFVSRMLESK
jgi:hypothetical protein